MAYNVLDGAAGREEQVAAVVRAADPDVAVLPEVMDPAGLERLARATGCHARLAPGAPLARKVGVLSRRPLLDFASFRPRGAHHHAVDATTDLGGGRRLRVVGVHLFPLHAWFFEAWRAWELWALLRRVRSGARGPHLLAGDFNAVAPGDRAPMGGAPLWVRAQLWPQLGVVQRWALRPLRAAGYVDAFRALHPGDDGFTVPAHAPAVRLDYVFADELLAPRVTACRVWAEPEDAARRASDHLPVVADLDLEPASV
jgi:endonuclease/exonuclease/phosphatase family metal-dependent hydrolase